jgi:hypothetical protein
MKDREAFDGKLDFELTLVPYKGNTDWVDDVLIQLKDCLDSDELPSPGDNCDYCTYREVVGKKLLRLTANKKKGQATLGI